MMAGDSTTLRTPEAIDRPGRCEDFAAELKAEIKARVSCADVLRAHSIEYHGRDIRCPLPGHEDRNPSFGLCHDERGFKCHGCGRSGDVFTLEEELSGCDYKTAKDALRHMAGLHDRRRRPIRRQEPDEILWGGITRSMLEPDPEKTRRTVAEAAQAALHGVRKSGKSDSFTVTRTDVYEDPSGPDLIEWRFDDESGKKDYRTAHAVNGGFRLGDCPGKLPLLNKAALLASSGIVYVCEGPKTCEAGARIGLLCTTSAHGSNSPHKTDWTLLQGRRVDILPDNDDAGHEYAEDVARLVTEAGAKSVRVVKLPGLPEKGDLWDFIEARRDKEPEDIRAEIEGIADEVEPWIVEDGSDSTPSADRHIIDPRDYYGNAKKFILKKYPASDSSGLIHHDDVFRRYVGTHYPEHDSAALRSILWQWLVSAYVEDENPDKKRKKALKPYRPNTNAINNTIDAIKAAANLPREVRPPCWLPGHDGPPAADILPFKNVLLHLPTGNRLPHTPGLFITHALPFDYDSSALATEWERFLHDLWPDDPEAIKVLQLMFGYMIGGGTELQKIFLLVGPKRGGKGTIARILVALLGSDACCGPTLAGLATPFGLQTLIGKRLAVISDARLSSRADQASITERLLTVSGEDTITVPRKYANDWTGSLPTRFLLLTNELPRLADSSGALASRFIVLTMSQSFYGREDHGLAARLLSELPGIANWAIRGWRDLKTIGRIVSPKSAQESIEELNDLGSPVGAFIRDCCRIGPECEIERATLYKAWCQWCESQGRQHPGTAESFGRDLRAAIPGLRTTNKRLDNGARTRFYQGIATE